ncbi:hypothetical protein BG22_07835 [Bifidobacterium sp. UTBIF-78]|nr:hypothetical protein BG22_07835 [Bifidobacterium sp. UTBIF-78]
MLALCVTLYALGTFTMMMQVLLGVAPAAIPGIIVTIVTGASISGHDSAVIGRLVDDRGENSQCQ